MTDTINKELEKQREYKRQPQKIYYLKNKEKITERTKQYKEEYYLKNKEEILEQQKKNRLDNIEK